jgi:outer membrane immunogenic protein
MVLAVVPRASAAESSGAASAGSWTGLYVGAGIGGKWADSDWTTTCFGTACTSGGVNPFFVDNTSPRTFITAAARGSVYAGFNWQLEQWLVGVEGDFGVGGKSKITPGIPGCTVFCGFLPPTRFTIDSASVEILRDSSIRGRAGFLLVPSVLVYGTGGVAFQRVNANLTCSFAGAWCAPPVFSDILNDTHKTTLRGWTAGGGLEWMVGGNLLVRGEYRYSALGHFRPIFFDQTQNAVFTDIHIVTEVVTIGFGYKF